MKINDQSKATGLPIVIDWDRHPDRVFAGRGKRICGAIGSRSKGQRSSDAGPIAGPRRTDKAIWRHLQSGRRGPFRIAGLLREVSRDQCAFYRYWSGEWSDVGVV